MRGYSNEFMVLNVPISTKQYLAYAYLELLSAPLPRPLSRRALHQSLGQCNTCRIVFVSSHQRSLLAFKQPLLASASLCGPSRSLSRTPQAPRTCLLTPRCVPASVDSQYSG
jgi:hypothetical protein